MFDPIMSGGLTIAGGPGEGFRQVTGTVTVPYSWAPLAVTAVDCVTSDDLSDGRTTIGNLDDGCLMLDDMDAALKIARFTDGTAVVMGTGNRVEIVNADGAEIEVGGALNTVSVRHGDVTYTVSRSGGSTTGLGTVVEDGDGDSMFFVDAFVFNISDGAGDDTIIVDGGDDPSILSHGTITLGDGEDVIWVISGVVDIFDFVLGEDTLLVGAGEYNLQGELDTFYPAGFEYDFDGGSVSVSFAGDGVA